MVVLRSIAVSSFLLFNSLPTCTSLAIESSSCPAPAPSCKCIPSEPCWPKRSEWQSFNKTLGGDLVESVPLARSCYPGKDKDSAECAQIDEDLTNSTFVASNPIALAYPPVEDACAPVNATAGERVTGRCTLEGVPLYSINATSTEDVVKGVNFARERNIRLVVRNTGHDILGRSTGGASMQIWLHNLRDGIELQDEFQSSDECSSLGWTGSAYKVGGGYVWGDIYPQAADNNLVVVGGGDPSVGIFGGWLQGGGHSPASRDFGLGADQLLEATVVTADGKVRTVSPCSNQDLYTALRGGGGSTYGIITSATIKAHPSPKVVGQTLALAPLSPDNLDTFMEAVAIVYESYPALFEAGYSGYGTWSLNSPTPFFANFTTGFTHAIAVFDQSEQAARDIFAPVAERLTPFNNTELVVSLNYMTFPSYDTYYKALSGQSSAVGTTSALASRLLDSEALTKSPSDLRATLKTTAGSPEEFTSNNICMVAPAKGVGNDTWSGKNPAWNGAVVHNIIARGWAPGTNDSTIAAIQEDVTFNKNMAQARLAPDTGSYMNEGDRNDPDYEKNFYGGALGELQAAKEKYDPEGVFYCPTGVGSKKWVERKNGQLCRRRD